MLNSHVKNDIRLMNPIEKARYFQELLKKTGLTQTELAKRQNVSQGEIANTIRLLELPEEILEHIAKGDLFPTHGRYLLRFNDDPDRERILVDRTIKGNLTIKELTKVADDGNPLNAQDSSTGKEKAEIKLITPTQAGEWLRQNNIHNRKLDLKWVKYLAKEIKEGRWYITNQGIGFSQDDRLLDGQHRLAAIMEAGLSVRLLVLTGMANNSFSALDSNKARSMEVRTGIPKYFTEIYNFMLVLTLGNTKTSPGDVSILHKHFGPLIDEMRQYCDAATKFYTSVPIRTAAVISIELDEDKEYILNTYKNLALKNHQEFNHVSSAFVKWHDESQNRNSTSNDRLENYLRALFVFKQNNKDIKQIHITKTTLEIYLLDTRGKIGFILHNNNLT